MKLMKFARAVIIGLVAASAMAVHAQQVAMTSWEAFVLPNPAGVIMQYSFPLGPLSFWYPERHGKHYKFGPQNCPMGTTSCVLVQTVDGVSELYLTDSHDFCKPACTFLGTLSTTPTIQQATQAGGATYQTVSGSVTGTFKDAYGNTFTNVPALFGFTTYPGHGDVGVPAVGSLIVTLQPN